MSAPSPGPPAEPPAPQPGAARTGTGSPSRLVDVVVAGLLCAGLTLLALVTGMLSLLTAMASDGCTGDAGDPLLCSAGGTLLFFAGVLVLWLVLAVAVVGSIVLVVRAAASGRRAWPWPFAGLGLGMLGVGAFVLWLVLLTH